MPSRSPILCIHICKLISGLPISMHYRAVAIVHHRSTSNIKEVSWLSAVCLQNEKKYVFTYLWKSWVHLFLSFKVGGLYPDFDIRNKALIGCKSNIGGCSSANSMAVIPTAQISQRWLYPPFLSTAATWNVNKVNLVNKQLTSSKYSYKLWKIASSKMLIVLLLETLSNAGFLV